MYATFNRFEIKMSMLQARCGSHQGSCDDDVKDLLSLPEIKRQLRKIGPDPIKEELKEYGAWSEEELNDVEQNKARIIWIACGNIVEEDCK